MMCTDNDFEIIEIENILPTKHKRFFYVYEITNIENDKKYIGWRSSNIEPEKDLGIRYFSSSTDNNFIEDQIIHPEKYHYKIIKITNTMKEAVLLESSLLEENNAMYNDNFYNKSNGCRWYYDSTGTKWITDGTKDIKINSKNIDMLDYYLEKGFYQGRSFNGNGSPLKNKIAIYKIVKNTKIIKYIYEFEKEDFLKKGYELGTGNGRNKFPVYCNNKQKWFYDEKERDLFLSKPENNCWKKGQYKRENFNTRNKVFVIDLNTKKEKTITPEEYKKYKWKKYISRAISNFEKNLNYGILFNEFHDKIFEGYYKQMKEEVQCSAKETGEIVNIKKHYNSYEYLEKIGNTSSTKLFWKTIKPWKDEKTDNQINYHQLKQKDIKPLREKLWKEQDEKCLICERKIKKEDTALDHCHDSGKIRGVLCKTCNTYIEGTFRSKWKRSGLSNIIEFEKILLNLYNYLTKEHLNIIHPSHASGSRKLMKNSYNELKRAIQGANKYLEKPIKIPPYPKSGRCTKRLCELFELFGIYPKYYNKR